MSAFFWRTAAGAFAVRHAMIPWPEFTLAGDALEFYCSSSEGDDGNDGLTPETPVATLLKLYDLMRDGYPDHGYLKRGDEWTIGRDIDALGESAAQDGNIFKKRGRGTASDEMMLFSTYGTGDRPLLKVKSDAQGLISNIVEGLSPSFAYVAFESLHFYQYQRDPDNAEYHGAEGSAGLQLLEYQDVQFIDVELSFFESPVLLTDVAIGTRALFFHCTLWMGYGEGSHGGGMYALDSEELAVQYGFFYHNGWLPADVRPAPVTNIAMDAATNRITRASGSFVTDRYRVGNLVAVSGFANNGATTAATGFTLVTGSETSGSYTDTATDNDVDHALDGDGSDDFEGVYEFDVSSMGVPQFALVRWELAGTGSVFVDGYDWADATWRVLQEAELPSGIGFEIGRDIPLYSLDGLAAPADFIGTGGDLNKVRLRFRSLNMDGTLSIDQIILRNSGNNGSFVVTDVGAGYVELDPGTNIFVTEAAEVAQQVDATSIATVFTRSGYISDSPGAVVQRCIDIDGASGGFQLRKGGTYSFNVSVRNPTAINFGHPEGNDDTISGTIAWSVAVGARDIENAGRCGAFGVSAAGHPFDGVEVHHCIATMNEDGSATGDPFAIGNGQMDALSVHDNIAYRFVNASDQGFGFTILTGATGDWSIADNEFAQPTGGRGAYLEDADVIPFLTLSGNTYYTTDDPNKFRIELDEDVTFAEWVAATGETGASTSDPGYPDPDRTIETYMESIGEAPYTIENFAAKRRANVKGSIDMRFEADAVLAYFWAGFGWTGP